jgi:hypothetical protein
MNLKARLRFEMFERVDQWRITHPADLPPASHVADIFAVVTAAIAEIEGKAAAQVSESGSARATTTTKSFARTRLQDLVEEINRIARATSMTIPGVLDNFRMPSSDSDQALLATARAFLTNAGPLKSEFIKRGLAETFLTELEEAITDFYEKIGDRNSRHESQVAATADLEGPFDRGMTAVLELRLIMPSILKDDQPALAAWRSASHVERHTGRKDPKPPSPAGPADPSDSEAE